MSSPVSDQPVDEELGEAEIIAALYQGIKQLLVAENAIKKQ